MPRRSLLLIYLLALCLVCLSTRAKLAQYGKALLNTPEITKATKLAEGRHMDATAVISVVTPVPCPAHVRSDIRPATPPLRAVTPSCWSPAAVRPPPTATPAS